MMNKGLSNHDHNRNNHEVLFDLKPKLQVFQLEDIELPQALLRVSRARDLSLALLQVLIVGRIIHFSNMMGQRYDACDTDQFPRHIRDKYFSNSGMHLLSLGQYC